MTNSTSKKLEEENMVPLNKGKKRDAQNDYMRIRHLGISCEAATLLAKVIEDELNNSPIIYEQIRSCLNDTIPDVDELFKLYKTILDEHRFRYISRCKENETIMNLFCSLVSQISLGRVPSSSLLEKVWPFVMRPLSEEQREQYLQLGSPISFLKQIEETK